MGKAGVNISVVASVEQAKRQLDRIQKEMLATGRAAQTGSAQMRSAMSTAGARIRSTGRTIFTFGRRAATGFAVAAGAAAIAGMKMFNYAGQLGAMEAKAKIVFGNQIGLVKKWARENAKNMGLSSRELVGAAANFADLLIPMGFTRKEAAKMTKDVVGLSGALSAWSAGKYNAAEVSEILAKAMLGEREQLKSLGIAISEADVKARLIKNGTEDLTGAQLQQAKATATQQLIFEKSTDAQTAYAKGGNKLQRAQARISAAFKEFRDRILIKLTPVFENIAKWAQKKLPAALDAVVRWWKENGEEVIKNVKAFGRGVAATFRWIKNTLIPALIGAFRWLKEKTGAFVQRMADDMLGFVDRILSSASVAFGWIPGIGPKLKKARDDFKTYRRAINAEINKFRFGEFTFQYTAAQTAAKQGNFRAAGGPVSAMEPYIVGEKGPELFVPRNNGTIIPNGATVPGTGSLTVNIVVNGSGDPQRVAREVSRIITREANARRRG